MDKKVRVVLVVMSLFVLGLVTTLSLWLTPARTELTPVSEEAARLLEESAQLSERETVAQLGKDLAELTEVNQIEPKSEQETNIEHAKRLAAEDEEYRFWASLWEKEAREKGWNIRQEVWTSNKDYALFLKRLLSVDEVVNTGNVEIIASDNFRVNRGFVHVDVNASLKEILFFLRGSGKNE